MKATDLSMNTRHIIHEWFIKNRDYFNLDRYYGINIESEMLSLVAKCIDCQHTSTD